ncbi:hypothetical protein CLV24_14317 [Pontibacter ummariensis]|uniref:Pyrroline-5-carboxylate reductase catalytic N-terminal domain-containing protein n=1 Tax=Pontibacter ummariensis TaxID=1610492 RepID=A0A239LJ37_9BACT|nr:NAD(P)-binding domain-containing protein [Pontibacter ummariensis]PRY03141.1 hypothetical protein CLV24_14317 [Pontibacter ummariensis]SNT30481.1 hypothetical protein SAMN06296052_14317 [Pontibacter ummariensis]
MKIAIIGTGRMGKALLKAFYRAYPSQILFAGRKAEEAQLITSELSLTIQAVQLQDALQADIIIPALWFKDLQPWVEAHREQLRGKILIDITNPFNATFDDLTTGYGTSAAEELQRLVPETKVVGAFKNTFWVVFDQPEHRGILSDVFLTSDAPDALEKVRQVLEPLPFRLFDAGKLKNNRTIERMTLLSRELSLKTGTYPRVSFHLWGV